MTDHDDNDHRQFLDRLAQALQVAALTSNRIAVMSRQQQVDAAHCVASIERAIAELTSAREREKGGAR